MKYYLVEIATGDAKIKGKGVYEYDSFNKAVANFHSKLGNAMKSDLYESELVVIIDDNGILVKSEKYTNPNYHVKPEPQPEVPVEE